MASIWEISPRSATLPPVRWASRCFQSSWATWVGVSLSRRRRWMRLMRKVM